MPITLNGDTGITTPGLTNTGSTTLVSLTTTGNTILGDQSTDTLNVANGNLVLNSSGNLGVGTTSPATKLDVNGDVTQRNGSGTTIGTISNNGGWYDFGASNNVNGAQMSHASIVRFVTNSSERARIDSSGNLLVGRSNSDGYRVAAAGTTQLLSGYQLTYSGVAAGSVSLTSNGAMAFGLDGATGATERARITTAGDFLVGGTSIGATDGGSPQINLISTVTTTGQWSGRIVSRNTGNNTAAFIANYKGAAGSVAAVIAHSAALDAWAPLYVNTVDGTSTNAGNVIMGGNLLVGTTSGSNARLYVVADGGAVTPFIVNNTASGSTGSNVAIWRRNGTTTGSIDNTGTTTSYLTSSDYRLKNTIAPMTGALAKVALLKPCTYKWNADGSDGEGFIAHELAEVEPGCVSGEKDAVDADGNPQYQGIDTSFLVATLTSAIQELKSELDLVKTELAALKGN